MNTLLQQILDNQNTTTTENGMPAYKSTNDACLDLFFSCGAMRNASKDVVIEKFSKAYSENKDLATLIFAYNRDIRLGNGERKVSRYIMQYLIENDAPLNWAYLISELGRWDDVLELIGTKAENTAFSIIKDKWESNTDMGLFAKWMPRKGIIAITLRNMLGLSPKKYRKALVNWTNVVETKVCNNDIASIDYTTVPSVANIKYNRVFLKKDTVRRNEFLTKAKKGEVKINSSVAYPYDIIRMLNVEFAKEGSTFSCEHNDTAIALWNQLPNLLGDSSKLRILPMCDFSGSMRSSNSDLPLMISMSLGLYISERNTGVYKNAFMSFSKTPQLQYFTEGSTIVDRVRQMVVCHHTNTNLESAFRLLLDNAKMVSASSEELPTHILIISDMQFDRATNSRSTAMEMIRNEYTEAGYTMPNIIFWNVNGTDAIPIKYNEDGVALVSGASPNTLKSVLSDNLSPISVLLRAVGHDRYYKLLK